MEDMKKPEGAEPKVEESKQPEVKDETKVEPKPVDNSAEVEKLKGELEELKKTAVDVEALNTSITAIQEDVKNKDSVINEYETAVKDMIESKMEAVPEEFKGLIPENLTPLQKLTWLQKAEATGVFNKETKTKPQVEVGKPLNVDVPQVDTSKLTGSQLLKMAYNTITK